jgi:hypothetical protein
VYITEWSADKHPDWYHVGLKLYMSVSHADLIGAYAKTGVAGYSMFGTVHSVTDSWGILVGNGGGDAWVNGTLNPGTLPPETPAPDYFMLSLWSKMGNKVLNATHAADAKYVFNAWAHKKDNGSVQVMLINKDTASQQNVTVKFTGFDPTGRKVLVYEMYKTKTYPWDRLDSIKYNTVMQPWPATNDLPPAIDGGICSGTTFTRTIPALSITVLDFVDPNAQAIGSRMISPKNNRLLISGNSGNWIQITCSDAAASGAVWIFQADGKMVDNLDMISGTAFWNTVNKPAGLYYVKMNSGASSQARAVSISR